MLDILITAFVVVFILGWLANVASLFERKTDERKIDIHIHNQPVKTTKIIDSLIEKDGHTHIYHEEVEEEGNEN